MSDLQERRYKEIKPEETVKKIKKILEELGIEVEENWTDRSSVNTYSLRICIKGSDVGQNGKGMTKEFAMASGYAEFLERLQNGLFRFRMEKPAKELPFINVPDEKYFSINEYINKRNSFLESILYKNGKNNKTEKEQKEFLRKILNAEYMDKNTNNHVLYRVTTIFEGNNLVANGVEIEAYSVEDNGKGICFNVYIYNVQPGINIDYQTGESSKN